MPRRNNTPKTTREHFTVQSCSQKRRFANKQAAQQQADLQMLQQPSLALGVYKCQLCRGWHLTSTQYQ